MLKNEFVAIAKQAIIKYVRETYPFYKNYKGTRLHYSRLEQADGDYYSGDFFDLLLDDKTLFNVYLEGDALLIEVFERQNIKDYLLEDLEKES